MNFDKKIKHKLIKAVKEFDMFNRKHKILATLSGGKDSLSLAVMLKELNFNIEALFIDLRFGDYSKHCQHKIQKLCDDYKIPLNILNVKNEIGITVSQGAEKYSDNVCSVCGAFKRKIFNDFGMKNGFDVVVTGHHLDDEAVHLLADNLRWDWAYMKKGLPVKKAKKGFIKRAKPLCFIREKEIEEYAKLKQIDYVKNSCPFEKEISRRKFEKILSVFEETFPNMVVRYYKNFLRNRDFLNEFKEENLDLKPCKICGDYTNNHTCKVCLIKNGQWKR